MTTIKAPCNQCVGVRFHEVLHSHVQPWEDDEEGSAGCETFNLLKCNGCMDIRLQFECLDYVKRSSSTTYSPAPILKYPPAWLGVLKNSGSRGNARVASELDCIYRAINNDLLSLAVMGIKSLLENILTNVLRGCENFDQKLTAFENLGYISRMEARRLRVALAACFNPESDAVQMDVLIFLEVAEHIVEGIYVHELKINALEGHNQYGSKVS